MPFVERVRRAKSAALKHLVASAAVALICAALVFGVWYPHPFDEMVGGRELFFLVVSVDVVCGPLLTFVVYNPNKPRRELWRDIGFVLLLQLAALAYGLHSVMEARPVYLAFEGDRFRVVVLPDIDISDIQSAPEELQHLHLTGPKPIGVRLAKSTDRDFPQSIQLALLGQHPAFRPSRWVAYAGQRDEVIRAARPMSRLRAKHASQGALIDQAIADSHVAEERLGYLPLLANRFGDWVVLVGLDDALPRAYLHLDGFD